MYSTQYRLWVAVVTVLVLLLLATSIWLGRKKRQLSRESRRLQELVASWPQPMLMIRGRALSDCNRAAVELLECRSAADMLGQPLERFSPEVQPDGQDSARKLAGLLQRVQVGDVAQSEWLFCREMAATCGWRPWPRSTRMMTTHLGAVFLVQHHPAETGRRTSAAGPEGV